MGQSPGQDWWDEIKDEHTDSLKVSSVHAKKVHDGKMFTTGHLFTTVADNAFAYLSLQNVHRQELHVDDIEVVAEGKSYVTVYEGASISSGTALAEVNHNTNPGSDVAQAVAKHTPTVSDNGILLVPSALVPGGTGPQSAGASAKADGLNELMIRPGGNLLVAVQNKGGAAKDISINCTWHEESTMSFTTTTTSSTTTTTTTTTA